MRAAATPASTLTSRPMGGGFRGTSRDGQRDYHFPPAQTPGGPTRPKATGGSHTRHLPNFVGDAAIHPPATRPPSPIIWAVDTHTNPGSYLLSHLSKAGCSFRKS
jgi:hypothetical protein